MFAEIAAGTVFGSMALLADGWHMGTHVAAFLITLFAYRYARRHALDPGYTFGTGKVGVLGGFASAIALAVVALLMLIESLQRMFEPQSIAFDAALAVAVVGLCVNRLSAFVLGDAHEHADHDTDHHPHHDHNLRAAYVHVLADALTSVLAIIALVAGKVFGAVWMDPVMGIVGAIIITRWSYGLLRQTSPILLDGGIEESERAAIRTCIESDADNRVADMHIWRVGAHHTAAIISVVTHLPRPAAYYRELLRDFHALAHVTVEVHTCEH
jgi:cation diffusion facilitator family transporter